MIEDWNYVNRLQVKNLKKINNTHNMWQACLSKSLQNTFVSSPPPTYFSDFLFP